MEFKLEAKKYQERVEELESTVQRLQRELELSRETNSRADGQSLSENEETAAAADFTNDNRQHEQV